MALTIVEKLRIKPGYKIMTINATADFAQGLGKLPTGASLATKSSSPDQIHWFVNSKAQMEKEFGKVFKQMSPEMIVWIYFPKGSSGMQTDLSRDKGWDELMKKGEKLTWISLISFDKTWSVFGIRLRTEEEKKKQIKPTPVREIFQWTDPVKKTVTVPDDVSMALSKNKKAMTFFDQLSFTNKKEYLEWIITAKREETRNERIKGTLERLSNLWKNPRNT